MESSGLRSESWGRNVLLHRRRSLQRRVNLLLRLHSGDKACIRWLQLRRLHNLRCHLLHISLIRCGDLRSLLLHLLHKCISIWIRLSLLSLRDAAKRCLRVEGVAWLRRLKLILHLRLAKRLRGLLLLLDLTNDHALVLRSIEKLLVLSGQYLVLGLWLGVVDCNGLSKWSLRCLCLQTVAVMQAWLWLHMRRSKCLLVVLLLLSLLLGKLEALLKHLHHVIILLLISNQLLVEDFVDVCDRLLNFCKHLLKLSLKLWHDLVGHCLFELRMYNLANGLVTQVC